MPTADAHQSSEYTKLLLIGDSKSGKTGSLASLVNAGYHLRILDFDNGLDSLVKAVKQHYPSKAAELLRTIEFRTLQDQIVGGPTGPIIKGRTAFIEAAKMLDNWRYTYNNVPTDLGPPAAWGPQAILVIDSLTFMANAAFNFREPLTKGGDKRMTYFDAQNAIEDVLGMLYAESFRTNVIVIAHIKYMDMPDGTKKGFPTTIGSALSPDVPRYFNSYAMCQSVLGKRTIQTTSTALIDLANPASFKMAPSLPIETGLATFFETVRS